MDISGTFNEKSWIKMRLVCPNCGARYEVPKENIFATGRDVKCSACDTTWFQTHPDAVATRDASFYEGYDDCTQSSEAVLAELSAESITEEAGVSTSNNDASLPNSAAEGSQTLKDVKDELARRRLHPTVAEILRGEARREAEERAAEMLKVQTKFSVAETAQFDAPKSGLAENGNFTYAATVDATSQPDTKTSGEELDDRSNENQSVIKQTPIIENQDDARPLENKLLLNIEDINPSIASDKEVSVEEAGQVAPVDVASKKAGRLGFLIGFFFILGLFAIYQYEDRITAAYSPLVPAMNEYVSFVNRMRAYSDQSFYYAVSWLEFQAEQARHNETQE